MEFKSIKKYNVLLVILLGVSIFLLNYSSKIMVCSLFFMCIALLLNTMYRFYGRGIAFSNLILCLTVNFILLQDFNYSAIAFIDGLLKYSFGSLMLASFLGVSTLVYLKNKFNPILCNAASLVVYALVDGISMVILLSHQFTNDKLISMFIKELSYKFGYALIAVAFVAIIEAIYKKSQKNVLHGNPVILS